MEKRNILHILNEIPHDERSTIIGEIGEEFTIAKYKKLGYKVERLKKPAILYPRAKLIFKFVKEPHDISVVDFTLAPENKDWNYFDTVNKIIVFSKRLDQEILANSSIDNRFILNIATKLKDLDNGITFAEKCINGDCVGLPDLFVENNNDFFFVEVKTSCRLEKIIKNRENETPFENLLKPDQLKVKKDLEKLGFRYVVDVVEYENF